MITVKKKAKYILPLLLLTTGFVFAKNLFYSKIFSFKTGEKYKRIRSMATYYVASGNRLASIKRGVTE